MLVYRFESFELDTVSRRLFRGRQRLSLSDAQFAILLLLVTSEGEVVPREALNKAGWGNTAVSETSLAQAIRRLRQILGKAADGTDFIETHNNIGYRFTVPVERRPRRDTDTPASSAEAEIALFRDIAHGRTQLDTLDRDIILGARETLRDAVRRAPHYGPAHVDVAMACGLLFESTTLDVQPDVATLAEGLEHARIARELAPASVDVWSASAFLLRLQGANEEAAAAAGKATSLDPQNPRHLLLLGYASWGHDRIEAARRLLALHPGLALGHWLIATVLISRGAFPAAREEIRLGCAAQDIHPKRAGLPALGLHLLDGLVHAAHGRPDDGLDALMRELPFTDSSQVYARECAANTWYGIGAIYRRQGKHGDADHALIRALAIAPGHVEAHAALTGELLPSAAGIQAAICRSIILARGGCHEQAARAYHDAIAQEPRGSAGWLLPVEPMLNPLARPDIWAPALALVRLRAT